MSSNNDSAGFLKSLAFDREMPLEELLSAVNKKKLAKVLSSLLHEKYRITNLSHQCLLGEASISVVSSRPILVDLEAIGFLETQSSEPEAIEAALDCIMLQITFAQKYLMASALHIEAIQEDYSKLCKEHEQVLLSEANYKDLCEHLDEKVKEQVETIERSQLKLFESEKMASIGHLAAGVAHEINNPIGFINSNLNTARNYLKDLSQLGALTEPGGNLEAILDYCKEIDLCFILDDFADLLNESIEGSKRVTRIVADLKLFSSIDSAEEETIDIRQYIQTTCNVAQTAIAQTIRIAFSSGELPAIKCRPGYIGQVILALIMNAADAYESEGLIKVGASFEQNKVFIAIEDEGKGIPPEVIRKVFDPFFTTKDVGKGKGLGLTSCKDIICAHKGEIDIKSECNKGTKVSFWLPV